LPVPWNEDDPRDLAILEDNLRRVLTSIVRGAARRDPPSAGVAQAWHRSLYHGVRLPVPYYAGEIRDSDPEFPELFGYEVAVGASAGVPSRQVPAQLRRFETFMVEAVRRLDQAVRPGTRPEEADRLHSVLTLCAISHGEWVRIHPFANGNGRTARLWANWCASRYGLPPFVRLMPRPEGDAYAVAAADSMRGDHRAMVIVFADLLERRLAVSA
jgi:fido (protein-threonine AMPylation protein)